MTDHLVIEQEQVPNMADIPLSPLWPFNEYSIKVLLNNEEFICMILLVM